MHHPLNAHDHPGCRGEGRRVPPGRGGRRPGRGGRARRGDIRASLLVLLAEEPQHGYQLMKNLEERTNGAWRPSPGSVYPTLAQLEDEGLVTSTDRDGRRTFTITDAGRDEVAARDGDEPWGDVGRGRAMGDLRPMMVAMRQIVGHGTPEQIEAADAVVVEARRKLYLILADEPAG